MSWVYASLVALSIVVLSFQVHGLAKRVQALESENTRLLMLASFPKLREAYERGVN